MRPGKTGTLEQRRSTNTGKGMNEHMNVWLSALGLAQALFFFIGGIVFKMGWSIVEELRRTNERQELRINALSVSIAKFEELGKMISTRFDKLEDKLDRWQDKNQS